MKLKNKISGEIKEFSLFYGEELQGGATLKSLTDEWEDVPEEPKGIQCIYYVNHFDAAKIDGVIVGFGNKEEAEKAVEKLKAWKRLKDGGFTIRYWRHTPDMNLTTGSLINIKGFIPEVVKNMKDLDLLFGGEE